MILLWIFSKKIFKKILVIYSCRILSNDFCWQINIFKVLYKKKKGGNIIKRIQTVQQWLPFEKILDSGIIKLKNNSFIKILKISPINFNLKSNLEKESILNSYKTFLKTCNFDIQILIQSNKEDLSNHILKIQKNNLNKNEKIKNISNNYINYIQEINKKRKSSSKNFYILIRENPENKKQKINENLEKIYCDKLNEKYFKIKESLSRCGNKVIQFEEKEEVEKIINSFFNTRKELNKIWKK